MEENKDFRLLTEVGSFGAHGMNPDLTAIKVDEKDLGECNKKKKKDEEE